MKKMDEMELSITLKATKWAWGYTILFLAIWVVYDYTQTGILGLGFLLLVSQNIVLRGSELFLKWEIGKDEK
ncbi:hypothetical protein [Clostridium sp.]|uniref:hypothetical protein n=1 Tax=Clostridium sp. TaxID=1506 RepID=UPI001A3BD982|nr:hypothetical protein [Clostridium sp.]MBK5234850.1 hypothetical protein [Clostridium sp.]